MNEKHEQLLKKYWLSEISKLKHQLDAALETNKKLQTRIDYLENELLMKRWLDGRPQKLTIEQQRIVLEKRKQGVSIQKLAEEFSCSTSTIYSITKGVNIDLRRKKNPSEASNQDIQDGLKIKNQ